MHQARLLRFAFPPLVATLFTLLVIGCGSDEPPAADVEQYKEAKEKHDVIRAKEYGRSSVDDSGGQGRR